MKKIISLLILINVSFGFSQAQKPNNEPKVFNVERPWFTGGGLGLQFGTITNIDLSPIIGYRITDHFAIGLGGTYQYYNDKRYNPHINASMYGGRVFARYYVHYLKNFFAHAELEILNYEKFNAIGGTISDRERIWEGNPLAGIGYRQMVGEFSSMHLSVLWNFNQSPYSVYTNPLIRISFNIQL